jgi:hypothetical protein
MKKREKVSKRHKLKSRKEDSCKEKRRKIQAGNKRIKYDGN